MSAQGLAFTSTFALVSETQFQPEPPARSYEAARTLMISTPSRHSVAGPDRRAPSTRRPSPLLGGQCQRPLEPGSQPARAGPPLIDVTGSNRLLALLNIAMADTAITTWSAKRFYGNISGEVTWRPATSIPLADSDENADTAVDSAWQPLINTPCHPEYPAGHPHSQRSGSDEFYAQPLQRPADVYADDARTAGSHRIRASHRHVPTETMHGSGAACTTRAQSR